MTPLDRAATGTNPLSARRRPTRRVVAIAVMSALAITACGGDDDDAEASASTEAEAEAAAETTTEPAADTTDATTSTDAATTAAPATTAAATATSAAATAGSTTAAGSGQVINVDLVEFDILLDAEIAAGPVTFNIENTGQFPHDMHVFRGTYAELPQKASGAVDDAAVPAADNLGFVEPVQPGASATLSVEFTPGTYTLVCNVEGGGSSHAARGQIVEVVVA